RLPRQHLHPQRPRTTTTCRSDPHHPRTGSGVSTPEPVLQSGRMKMSNENFDEEDHVHGPDCVPPELAAVFSGMFGRPDPMASEKAYSAKHEVRQFLVSLKREQLMTFRDLISQMRS